MADFQLLPRDVGSFQVSYKDGRLRLTSDLPERCAFSVDLWNAVYVKTSITAQVDRTLAFNQQHTGVLATETQFTVHHTRGTFTYEKESDTPHAGQFWICRLVSREDK